MNESEKALSTTSKISLALAEVQPVSQKTLTPRPGQKNGSSVIAHPHSTHYTSNPKQFGRQELIYLKTGKQHSIIATIFDRTKPEAALVAVALKSKSKENQGVVIQDIELNECSQENLPRKFQQLELNKRRQHEASAIVTKAVLNTKHPRRFTLAGTNNHLSSAKDLFNAHILENQEATNAERAHQIACAEGGTTVDATTRAANQWDSVFERCCWRLIKELNLQYPEYDHQIEKNVASHYKPNFMVPEAKDTLFKIYRVDKALNCRDYLISFSAPIRTLSSQKPPKACHKPIIKLMLSLIETKLNHHTKHTRTPERMKRNRSNRRCQPRAHSNLPCSASLFETDVSTEVPSLVSPARRSLNFDNVDEKRKLGLR